jgi:hypothetical protein
MKIILFLLINTTILFSQTKKNTEEWINNNINYYPVSYGNNPISISERIEIEDGILYFYYHWKKDVDNYFSGSWSKINLKNIKSIEYSYDKSPDIDNKWINLTLNFQKGKCYERDALYPNDSKNQNGYQIQPERTIIKMRLNLDYVDSGMKLRIEKAFAYLIKQYGGNTIIKKEPF